MATLTYTLMRGPNGEALVYDGSTVQPLPDPASGAPLRFEVAQAKWQDLLPTIPQLLQQGATAGLQPGVVPPGYNPPAPNTAPPSGPPRQSADGHYSEVDTPDGRMIQDNQSGVRYSRNMAPQDVLNSLYGPGAQESTRPANAATPVGQTAAPIINGVVQNNVQGNPTAAERALGTVSTLSGGVDRPPSTQPIPGQAAPAPAAGAPSLNRLVFPRMQLPQNIDPTASASSLFNQYVGTYNQPLPPPRPTTLPNVAQGPGVGGDTAAPGTTAQNQGPQFRPLSIPAPAPAAAPVPIPAPQPQVSMKPAPVPLSAPPQATVAAPISSPTINVNGQQVATLQPSAIVGSAAYNAQQAQNLQQQQAANAAGTALANTRVWGYAPDTSGENGAGAWGWYLPSQLANPPGGAAPNPLPQLTGQPAPLAAPANANAMRPLSAISGGPVYGGGNPNPPAPGEGPQTGPVYNPILGRWENPDGTPAAAPPGAPSGTAPTTGTAGTGGGAPAAGASGGETPAIVIGSPNDPQPATPANPGYVWQHKTTVDSFGRTIWSWEQVPARQEPGTINPIPQPTPVTPEPGFHNVPQYNSVGQIVGWTQERDITAPGTSAAVTLAQQQATLDATLAGIGLTQAQIDQMKAMLPINIAQGTANVAQTYAAIANAAAQLGLNIDQQKFNQAYQTATLTGQLGDQATLAREQTYGFNAQGTPTLAALNQQVQNALGYAASNRADIGVQQQQAQIMGYDAQGNPTLAGQTAVSSEDRANLLAQASIGNQAATIRLQELAQQEGQRQFDINNEQAWRQNPSSIFDRVYNNRAGLPAAAPTAAVAPGAPLAAPASTSTSTGTQYTTMSAPVTTSTPAAAPPAPTSAANMTLTAPADRSPLTYGEIKAAGAEPPGIAAATSGQRNMGTYQPAGGMPMVSGQAYNQLNPEERQVFDAQLRATGNDPATYAFNRQRLTAPAIRTSGGFSAPRRLMPAGSL